MHGINFVDGKLKIYQDRLKNDLREFADINITGFNVMFPKTTNMLEISYESANNLDYCTVDDLYKFENYLKTAFSFKELKLTVSVNTRTEIVYVECLPTDHFDYVLI